MAKCYRKHPSSTEWSKIQECASERKSWWPKYHFASFSMISFEGVSGSAQNSAKLSKYKRKGSLYLKFKGILHLHIVIIAVLFWVIITLACKVVKFKYMTANSGVVCYRKFKNLAHFSSFWTRGWRIFFVTLFSAFYFLSFLIKCFNNSKHFV